MSDTDDFETLIIEHFKVKEEKDMIRERIKQAERKVKKAQKIVSDLNRDLEQFTEETFDISDEKLQMLDYIDSHPRRESLKIQEKVNDIIEEFKFVDLKIRTVINFTDGNDDIILSEKEDGSYSLYISSINGDEKIYREYPIILKELLSRFNFFNIQIIYDVIDQKDINYIIRYVKEKYEIKVKSYPNIDFLVVDLYSQSLFGG